MKYDGAVKEPEVKAVSDLEAQIEELKRQIEASKARTVEIQQE